MPCWQLVHKGALAWGCHNPHPKNFVKTLTPVDPLSKQFTEHCLQQLYVLAQVDGVGRHHTHIHTGLTIVLHHQQTVWEHPSKPHPLARCSVVCGTHATGGVG